MKAHSSSGLGCLACGNSTTGPASSANHPTPPQRSCSPGRQAQLEAHAQGGAGVCLVIVGVQQRIQEEREAGGHAAERIARLNNIVLALVLSVCRWGTLVCI